MIISLLQFKSLYKFITLLVALLSLGGCIHLNASKNWPSELPDRSIFVNDYLKRTNPDPSNFELNQHLGWIKKFYLGSILYPIGWNEMIDYVAASLESTSDKEIARQKLIALGISISTEWAQANTVRKINSANIAVWGNSLRTAAENNDQLKFINIVEQDVDDLLAGTLVDEQITRERYYPPEDYDNF